MKLKEGKCYHCGRPAEEGKIYCSLENCPGPTPVGEGTFTDDLNRKFKRQFCQDCLVSCIRYLVDDDKLTDEEACIIAGCTLDEDEKKKILESVATVCKHFAPDYTSCGIRYS